MEPTQHDTEVRPLRDPHYPSMTGEERLKALRSIRGMWKGKQRKIRVRPISHVNDESAIGQGSEECGVDQMVGLRGERYVDREDVATPGGLWA